MDKKNVSIGIGSVVFGAFFFISALGIKEAKASSASASLFPKIITAMMVIMGLLLLLREYVRMHNGSSNPKPIQIKNGKLMLVFCASMLLYALLLEILGFLICTFLYLTAMAILLDKENSRRSMLYKVLFGGLLTAAIYLMFNNFFNASLPIGMIFGG